MRVIIAAAGTAGHINPGIAIANKIKEKNKKAEIIFIGTDRGIENDLVPRAGYELKKISAYGLSKKISLENIKKMYKTLQGFKEAKKIIKEFKPDVVIGTGGYICGAVIWQANKLNIPTLLHESNAFPGRAVQMLSKKTNTIMVSFKDTITLLPKCKNVVFTGTPVKIKKKQYTEETKTKIMAELELNENKPIVLAFGGSQGAKVLNESIAQIAIQKLNENYQIVLASGQKQYEDIKKILKESNLNIEKIENMKIVPYIYNMEEVMNISNLIVSRSGAMTITEISNLGKASILIPLPNVSHNHQYHNARTLEKNGAAKIILNNELTADKLNFEIKNIVGNKETLKSMSDKSLENSVTNVEETIYGEIEKLVNGKT